MYGCTGVPPDLVPRQQTGLTCLCHDAQVLLLIRQIEATATTGSAARISVLCIGQQAIMDAYLCLLHLTTGAAQIWTSLGLAVPYCLRCAIPLCEALHG